MTTYIITVSNGADTVREHTVYSKREARVLVARWSKLYPGHSVTYRSQKTN